MRFFQNHITVFLIILILSSFIFSMSIDARPGSKQTWDSSAIYVLEKCKKFHGLLSWNHQNPVWYVNTKKQFDPAGKMVMEISEIHCYKLKPRLKIFTQTVDRLPLTVKIFNGYDFGIWRNGAKELDPSTISLATFQTLWEYSLGNFPFILMNFVNLAQYKGEETIGNKDFVKIRIDIDRSLNREIPHRWYMVYFDIRTGRIEKMLGEIGLGRFRDMIQITEFDDYNLINGILVPQRIRVYPANKNGTKSGSLLVEITRKKISFQRPITEDLFNFDSHMFLKK